MSEEILKVLEKLKDKNNYQRDCNDGSCFMELFANEIYILCEFIEDLQQKVEQLEKENFNIRENIHLERISLPHELTKDKTFMELYDIPSYGDLKNKVEQLENIRKEVVEYIEKHARIDDEYPAYIEMLLEEKQYLLNILNKGSEE